MMVVRPVVDTEWSSGTTACESPLVEGANKASRGRLRRSSVRGGSAAPSAPQRGRRVYLHILQYCIFSGLAGPSVATPGPRPRTGLQAYLLKKPANFVHLFLVMCCPPASPEIRYPPITPLERPPSRFFFRKKFGTTDFAFFDRKKCFFRPRGAGSVVLVALWPRSGRKN